MRNYLDLGNHNAICFRCGRRFKANQLIKQWQGYYVCDTCNEIRHPQDFVRAQPDNPSTPWTQPTAGTLVPVCTPDGSSAVPGYGYPPCVTPSYMSPFYMH